ncbi:MAG: carbohydrate kinase, partial [Clostridiales bacterium]|nr:carbohydrate kinase [Clostridiales bacterium]
MKPYLLGIDVGTSACKVALFDSKGHLSGQINKSYPVYYPKEGWAEQNPLNWKNAVFQGIRELIEYTGIHSSDIAAIGVAGQSWSAVAIDQNGEVLCNTPIWTDTRAKEECQFIHQHVGEKAYFELCGNPIHPSYTLPKILWYKNHLSDIYHKTAWILQSNSYIVYCLTGAVTQDLSQGYGLGCFNMHTGQWDLSMANSLGIRPSLLPPIVSCHEVVGYVTASVARQTGLCEGIPVVAGGLDAACGALGAGVIQAGQTQEQGGQAGGMSICLDQYVADKRLILGYHVVPGKWLLQGGTTGGGGALKWFRETCCPDISFEQMSELADTVPAGSEGVVFLPYMAGERSPIWNPNACGVFYGLHYARTKAHFIRSVMEGVAYALH